MEERFGQERNKCCMQNAIKGMSKGVVYFAKRKRKRKTIASPKEIHQEELGKKKERKKKHTSTENMNSVVSFFKSLQVATLL